MPDAQTSFTADSSGRDDSGLAFPSAAAEAEFERRCRLSRLGNGHLEDTGVAPVATESGPDLPLESAAMYRGTQSAFLIQLREDIDRFQMRSREAEFERGAVAFMWRCQEPELQAAQAAGAIPVLCWGAFGVLIELFRRYPGGGERDALLAWLDAARSLSLLFDRIGIWPLLAEDLTDNAERAHAIRTMAAFLDLHLGSGYMDYLGLEPGADAFLHFIHWALNLESVEFHRFEGPDVLPELGCRTRHHRILWELQSLPVAACADAGASEGGMLFGMVMPLLGSPGNRGFNDEAVSVALFLATCMASADHRLKRGRPWFSWDQPYSFVAEAQREAVQSLLAHAIAWLGGTLPHYAFCPATESAIETVQS